MCSKDVAIPLAVGVAVGGGGVAIGGVAVYKGLQAVAVAAQPVVNAVAGAQAAGQAAVGGAQAVAAGAQAAGQAVAAGAQAAGQAAAGCAAGCAEATAALPGAAANAVQCCNLPFSAAPNTILVGAPIQAVPRVSIMSASSSASYGSASSGTSYATAVSGPSDSVVITIDKAAAEAAAPSAGAVLTVIAAGAAGGLLGGQIAEGITKAMGGTVTVQVVAGFGGAAAAGAGAGAVAGAFVGGIGAPLGAAIGVISGLLAHGVKKLILCLADGGFTKSIYYRCDTGDLHELYVGKHTNWQWEYLNLTSCSGGRKTISDPLVLIDGNLKSVFFVTEDKKIGEIMIDVGAAKKEWKFFQNPCTQEVRSELSGKAYSQGKSIFFTGADDQIHQAYIFPHTGYTWKFHSVSSACHAPQAVPACTPVFDYAMDTERVYYIDVKRNVIELYCNKDTGFKWRCNRLPCNEPCISQLEVFAGGNQNSIYYLGGDQRIHEISYEWGKGWTAILPCGTDQPPVATSKVMCLESNQGKFKCVYYIGNDRRIHELYFEYGVGPWKHHVPCGDRQPDVGGLSCACTVDDGYTKSVFYRGSDSKIHELYINSSSNGWQLHTHNVECSGDPIAIYDGTTKSVFFKDNRQRVNELYIQQGKGWSSHQPRSNIAALAHSQGALVPIVHDYGSGCSIQ